jgi:hypothetical protein
MIIGEVLMFKFCHSAYHPIYGRSADCPLFLLPGFFPNPESITSLVKLIGRSGVKFCWDSCLEDCFYNKVVVFNNRMYPVIRPPDCPVLFYNSAYMIQDFSLELLVKNILCSSRCTWGKDHGC